jgi:hypothetical protein
MIRPRDPQITTPTLAYAPYKSAEACRRLMQLAYRDCVSVLDLTYSTGGFWNDDYLPPSIVLHTNNYEAPSGSTYGVDFTDTKLNGKSFDLVVYDPPHVADGGVDGIMANRFGTARGTAGLRTLIREGFLEACRLARLGVLVKVADHAHGGEWLSLSDWVKDMRLGDNQYAPLGGPYLYCVMHTYRSTFMDDPKWTVQRVPRSNGAMYMAFRLDSNKHRDFDREYQRQVPSPQLQTTTPTP